MSARRDQPDSNILGKFRLIAELGRGGMSEVFLSIVAGPAGFNKLTVIKLIKGDLAEDPEFISMFLEEARLSARLNHPNIVQTNEVGQDGSRYFIAMEYLEGQPYSRILNRIGRDRGLPVGMSLRILSDVLAGLHYAHELKDFDGTPLGVVHRDVTPHNVFVTYDGQVKVVDFGIAKAINSGHETRTGMLKGKVGYMAPEQARGERVDRRADVFSIGVMLWEAAVGRRMWKGLSEVQVLHQLIAGEIPRPRSIRPDISEGLDGLIMKTLALDRQGRYNTCAEVQAELDELLDSSSERTTLREVGRRVSTAFEDERSKLRQIIEEQVSKSNTLATGTYNQMALPVFDPGNVTGEQRAIPYGDQSGAFPAQSFSQGSISHHGSLPHAGSLPQLGSQSGSNPSVSNSLNQGSYSSPGTPVSYSNPSVANPSYSNPSGPNTHSSLARPGGYGGPNLPQVGQHNVPPSYSHPHTGSINVAPQAGQDNSSETARRLTYVALAVALGAAALIVILFVAVGRQDKTKTQNSSNAASGTSTSSSEAQKETPKGTAPLPVTSSAPSSVASSTPGKPISVKVVVKPKNASIFLDDERFAQNPTQIPRDGAKHELRAEATGYATRTKDFTADSDLTWDLELSPAAATQPTTPIQGGNPSGGHGDPNGMMVTPTSRPIDTGYPGGG